MLANTPPPGMGSSAGARQSSGVSRRLGDAGGGKGSGARWKKMQIFVLCH